VVAYRVRPKLQLINSDTRRFVWDMHLYYGSVPEVAMIDRVKAVATSTILALLVTGCGPSFTIRSEQDPSANIAAFETFGWVSENPLVSAATLRPVSPLMEGRIMNAVRTELEAQGYRFVDDVLEADFAIAFTLGSRERIRVESYPAAFRTSSTWSRSSRAYWFHTGTTPPVRTTTTTTGQLGIDIFDVASKNPVWHGTAETLIGRSALDDPEPVVNEAVQRILAEFGA